MNKFSLSNYRDCSFIALGREWWITVRIHPDLTYFQASIYYAPKKYFIVNLTIWNRTWSAGWTKPKRG